MNLSDYLEWPQGIPLLAIVPALFVLLVLFDRQRRKRLQSVLGPRLGELAREWHQGQRRFRRFLAVAALGFAVIALLRPAWGEAEDRVAQRGLDIVLCLDVSRSMLARDLDPDRLSRAREEISALAKKTTADRLGLVIFAGEAKLRIPLTRDRRSFMDIVDSVSPLDLSVGGTDLGAALEVALDSLGEEAQGENEVIILLTDGEDLEGAGLQAAVACARRKVRVHTVGVGSTRGSKVTVRRGDSEFFLRDSQGQDVLSKLDPTSLIRIAEATGGQYVSLGQETPLVTLYEDHIGDMARKTYAEEDRSQREPRFQWPLLLALILWVLEFALTDRRAS